MTQMMGPIGQLSHLVATLAFLLLGIVLGFRRGHSGIRLAVAFASILTAFWAAAYGLSARYGKETLPYLSVLETVRQAAWIAVLLILQRRSLGLSHRPQQSFAVALGIGFIVALQLALDMMFQYGSVDTQLSNETPGALVFVASRLVMAISGLVLLHNLYVNSENDGGVEFRLFAVGVGLFCTYDLNLYTLHFLIGEANQTLMAMRGAVNALAVPLLYLALRQDGPSGFQLSRQAAFQTVSFSMIGLYLIAMSILAYGLKMTGGDWGQLLQITFLAITFIAGALVVLSPRFRAELRVRISRNFYRYRYDYRVEWLGFIAKLDNNAGNQSIRVRLIEAVARVLDCPGGALLELDNNGDFHLTGQWRWRQFQAPELNDTAPIALFFQETGRIVDFDQLRLDALLLQPGQLTSHGMLTLPDWAHHQEDLWLAVPLIHQDRLIAFLCLERSIAARELNWEDFDLLRTLGRQGASYLAEAATQAQLDEARTFDEFNRRFAFVMHDVKNVISQLGLVARNAEKHAHKPEFREDMIATLNSSVSKMNDLLKLMSHEAGTLSKSPATSSQSEPTDIAHITAIIATTLRRQHHALALSAPDKPVWIMGDAQRLEAMLTHLVQNAIDASAPDAPILISLDVSGRNALIRVADRGQGMSQSFIKEELFKPFRSTKNGGFGIGAYETREIVRAHGGRLDVESQPGEGTCFTVQLPLAAKPQSAQSNKVSRS